jgi:hypothetical protein
MGLALELLPELVMLLALVLSWPGLELRSQLEQELIQHDLQH